MNLALETKERREEIERWRKACYLVNQLKNKKINRTRIESVLKSIQDEAEREDLRAKINLALKI